MKAIQCVFQRYEKKYMMNQLQYQKLMKLIAPHMQLDEYGKHTISNIYYDTNQFELIRTSLEKPVYKEKLRLRSYGIASDQGPAFLELKKKVQGIVYKRRECMPYAEVMQYLNGDYIKEKTQILKEID